MTQKTVKIVSGGQTGTDRGALMAALDRGVPCGGWCPEGRKAEDGSIPRFFPVSELESADYKERTVKNVMDTDATCIVHFNGLDEGSKLAAAACRREQKPYLYLDAHEIDSITAATDLLRFVREHDVDTLNVSGPRASLHPAAQAWTRATIREFLIYLSDRRRSPESAR